MPRREPVKEPDPQAGAYRVFTHVACHNCGQLTRIEVAYPLVQASSLSKPKFCPLCGAEYNNDGSPSYANGSHFKLVAAALFRREPSEDEVQIIASVYPTWDGYEHPTFKEYLRSLAQK